MINFFVSTSDFILRSGCHKKQKAGGGGRLAKSFKKIRFVICFARLSPGVYSGVGG